MRGLDPRIHHLRKNLPKRMDCRVKPGNDELGTRQNEKRRAEARRFRFSWFASDHCSRRSTLCCDWLASASAEPAIDGRVDSAWLLAASSLVSASVRLDEPVCNTLIRFLLKS